MHKHICILGIGGTFMGGLAVIAKQMGFQVSGCDNALYPPMSDRLREAGIDYVEGYEKFTLDKSVATVVIGNALSRGNVAVEAVLNAGVPYFSGAQWLYENILCHKHVLAVSGTHGKTTTTSILTWILHVAGKNPGYLIGGSAKDLATTAQLGDGDYFVIEADEYDTAFFDKRSKFLHYRPQTLIINNLEFDHGDIFPDLEAIKLQFQYLLRTVPSKGCVIYPKQDSNVVDVIARGCYSKMQKMGRGDWHVEFQGDGSEFIILHQGAVFCEVNWQQFGEHNVKNALAACVAAQQIGVSATTIKKALQSFSGVRRRLDVFAKNNEVTFYDDFAHHPTAINCTLTALRQRVGKERVIAVAEFASNTMKAGMHSLAEISQSFVQADEVFLLNDAQNKWRNDELQNAFAQPIWVMNSVNDMVIQLKNILQPRDHVVIMSNKSFDGIYNKLV